MADTYVRVYHRIIDDPKFESVYTDNNHLATWLRLLLMADAAWPASVPVPRSVRPSSLRLLVSVGLVDMATKDSYRIHGLDRERDKRQQHGRNAAASRWHSESNAAGNAPSNAQTMPSRAEQSRAQQNRAEQNNDESARAGFRNRMVAAGSKL